MKKFTQNASLYAIRSIKRETWIFRQAVGKLLCTHTEQHIVISCKCPWITYQSQLITQNFVTFLYCKKATQFTILHKNCWKCCYSILHQLQLWVHRVHFAITSCKNTNSWCIIWLFKLMHDCYLKWVKLNKYHACECKPQWSTSFLCNLKYCATLSTISLVCPFIGLSSYAFRCQLHDFKKLNCYIMFRTSHNTHKVNRSQNHSLTNPTIKDSHKTTVTKTRTVLLPHAQQCMRTGGISIKLSRYNLSLFTL
jgi:hypothetical protein